MINNSHPQPEKRKDDADNFVSHFIICVEKVKNGKGKKVKQNLKRKDGLVIVPECVEEINKRKRQIHFYSPSDC